jgi:hypothetical protein
MTVIQSSRRKLDNELDDRRNVLLILSADTDGSAKSVHDAADPGFPEAPYRKTFLLEDLGVVEAGDPWGSSVSSPGHYVVWNCGRKTVRKSGPVSELSADGTPSLLLIRDAFAAPDPS